jgi:hypothetical protein
MLLKIIGGWRFLAPPGLIATCGPRSDRPSSMPWSFTSAPCRRPPTNNDRVPGKISRCGGEGRSTPTLFAGTRPRRLPCPATHSLSLLHIRIHIFVSVFVSASLQTNERSLCPAPDAPLLSSPSSISTSIRSHRFRKSSRSSALHCAQITAFLGVRETSLTRWYLRRRFRDLGGRMTCQVPCTSGPRMWKSVGIRNITGFTYKVRSPNSPLSTPPPVLDASTPSRRTSSPST